MAARDAETGGEQPGAEQISQGRRRLLAALAAAGGGGALLTQRWAKPIVDLVVVPLHAQGSPQPCSTTGTWICGGITFTASAKMLGTIECQGGQDLSACCADVVWKKPDNGSNQVQLTISHNSAQNLLVEVKYFTKTNTGCTNESGIGTLQINANQTVVNVSDISGDAPECTGIRVSKVTVVNGSEITACTGPCDAPADPIFGDFGIYVQLLQNNEACPA